MPKKAGLRIISFSIGSPFIGYSLIQELTHCFLLRTETVMCLHPPSLRPEESGRKYLKWVYSFRWISVLYPSTDIFPFPLPRVVLNE